MRRHLSFPWAVTCAFGLALAVRWTVWWHWYRDLPLVEEGTINDNLFYHLSANLLVDGHGFANPFEQYVNGVIEPSAAHPPGFTVYLSIFSFLGFDTVTWHRLASGLISASVVIPVGLLLRKLFGERTALIGMIAAALHPPLWMNDGLILSESMYIPIAAWALYFGHRVHEEPSVRRVLELTAVLSLGALTRSEPFMMFFLLLVPLLLLARSLTWRQRIGRITIAAAVAIAMLAPWVGRNLATFDEPTFLAVGPGYVLEIGNCDLTYSGEYLGYWHAGCDDGSAWPDGDESVIGAAKLERAQAYIEDNVGDVPKVMAARIGRLMGVYRPLQSADFDVFFERRIRSHVNLGLASHYLVAIAAVYGAVVLARRSTLIPVLAVAGTSVLTAAITFGIARYRVGADVVLVVLAAIALGELVERYGPATVKASAEATL